MYPKDSLSASNPTNDKETVSLPATIGSSSAGEFTKDHRVRWIPYGLIALVGAFCILFVHWQAAIERSELENQIWEHDRANAQRIRELRAKLSVAEKAVSVAEKKVRDLQATATRTSSPPAQTGLQMGDWRNDPAYARIWHKARLRIVQRQYGDAIAALNLPPEQGAKLRELLVARMDAAVDAREAGFQAGLAGPAVDSAMQAAMTSVQDEIKGLIGGDNFASLEAAQSTYNYKVTIENSVGLDLAALGSPLSPVQLSALSQACSDTMSKETGPQIPDPQTGLTPIHQTLLDRVTPTLSPGQVPVFRDYLVEKQQQAEYIQKHNPTPGPGG